MKSLILFLALVIPAQLADAQCGCRRSHPCCVVTVDCSNSYAKGFKDGWQSCYDNDSGGYYYGKQTKKQWPGVPDEVPAPEPAPDITPVPDVTPAPEPIPDVTPAPDPAPLPPEPPAPSPEPSAVVPTDPAALNTYVAQHLGGYVRANHLRNGTVLDIYQARGKQRITWAVAPEDNWQTAFVSAFIAKSIAKSGQAGIALVCHLPEPPEPPAPAPAPEPPAPPVPDAEVPVVPIDTPVEKKLYKFGGDQLVTAEAACRAAGLWLVVVNDKTGEVNRVVYATERPPVVPAPEPAPAPAPVQRRIRR